MPNFTSSYETNLFTANTGMTNSIKSTTIPTTHGDLYVSDTGNTRGPCILLIHGNSFSSKIFRHQLTSPNLTSRYRLVALDLPGHGQSSNAPDPNKSYTQPSYAGAAIEVLQHLGISEAVVLGWSLGGHIAIEMMPRFPGLRGIMIVGTPPVDHGEVLDGFSLANSSGEDPLKTAYPARSDLSEAEMAEYARICADPPFEDWMEETVKRTDQKTREIMFTAFVRSEDVTQRTIVETDKRVRVAVVNGKSEPWINLNWIRNINFAKLWRNECIEMEGLLHAPFWAKPDAFEPLLLEFMESL